MRSKGRNTRAQRAEASTVISKITQNESKTWHNHPARIAYVQLPDPASSLGTQNERHDTVSSPKGDTSANEIVQNKSSANSRAQSTIPIQASLLGLPAELRIRIYEHIWPGDLIHVSTHPCKVDTKGAWETNTNKSSWDTKRHFVRWTHTICQAPNDWEQAYTLSKVSNSELPVDRHSKCRKIQESFKRQRYVTLCPREYVRKAPFARSEGQKIYASVMTRKYGIAGEGGLERLYSTSKLCLDVLLTCRQIHSEARLLPYARSIWHFDNPSTMAAFAERVECSCHIKALGISDWSFSDITSSLKLLPHVSKLQYSCNYSSGYCGRMALASEMLDTLRYMPREERMALGLKDVEIVLGEDMGEQGRGVRRQIAEEMERLMMAG